MKKLDLEALRPGMILSRNITTSSGQVIIEAGSVLTNKLIARIDFYNISEAYIALPEPISSDEEQLNTSPSFPTFSTTNSSATLLDQVTAAVPTSDKQVAKIVSKINIVPQSGASNEVPKESSHASAILNNAIFQHAALATASIKPPSETISYSQKFRASKKFKDFQMAYTKQIYKAKDALDRVLNDNNFSTSSLVEDTLGLVSTDHVSSMEILDMLSNMRQIDDSVYAHSLNVSLIARILAKWLKFTEEECTEVTLAGLIHDLGKLRIPKEILNKPGKLTPEEFTIIKTHPQLGYDLIKDRDLNPLIKDAVLMHHERCNGGGYPDNRKADTITKYAKIIMIADVYDAMTAARCYRGPVCPFIVIGTFEKEGLQKYDPHYILTFLERIANTYQNNRVLLSDGTYATVILLNNTHLSKPIVEFDDGRFLDLSTRSNIEIIKVL